MLRTYLERGLAAGAVAGLVFGLYVALVGNPLVGYVEGLGHEEGHHAATEGGHHAAEGGHVVSEATTAVVSIGGGVLWGLLLGAAVFGVVYYFLEPAIPGSGVTKQYVLAGAGFVTASVSPWLVLPPQPAGVEAALSTETRILLYGTMVVAGALVCVLAGYTYNRLTARGTARPLAGLAALAPFALLAIPVAIAPSSATAGDVPATIAAVYRGFVVFGQAGLWFVLAGVHAWLSVRSSTETDPDAFADPGRPAD